MSTLMEAVALATASVERLHELGSVPEQPELPYGVLSGGLGGGDGYTLDSRAGLRRGLVTVQTFGHTTASASDHMDQVVDALLDHQLTFDGFEPSTPLRAALDWPAINRDPDDNGVVTATLPFHFTAAKESP